MSGATIPYHLRQHKVVDRRLFVDLLRRFERWRDLSDYVYLSMGAYQLEDHKLIHRILGLKKLIAFDSDGDVVARQMFNRPTATCKCVQMLSGDAVAQLEKTLATCGVEEPQGYIFWLDYTTASQIGAQIREFQTLLSQLNDGDIVRVTVNAHPKTAFADVDTANATMSERQRKQFASLTSKIKEFLPSWAAEEHMTQDDLPRVLSNAFGKAASKEMGAISRLHFRPLSIVRYADGQQMLSMTGVVSRKSEDAKMDAALSMGGWPFASDDWDTVHKLTVPDLTLRERLFLEREIVDKKPDEIVKDLGFDKAGDLKVLDFLDSYLKYYRFYPTLLAAEV